MNNKNLLSVVICTHNRACDVKNCLESLFPQIENSNIELIIVDSGSDAQQENALREITQTYSLTLIRSDKAGLSEARNLGVNNSRGEWIAFIDDDAVPQNDWRDNLLHILETIPVQYGAIGGRILPIFPDNQHYNLGNRWKMYVSLNDSVGSRDCTEKFELIGANSVFRRTALVEAGMFPVSLGRTEGKLLSGEDVYVMNRMRDLGWKIRYESAFCVGHKVSRQRLTTKWVHNRAFWEGVTTIRMARLLNKPYGKLAVKALASIPMLAVLSLVGDPAYEWSLRFWFDYGAVVETMRWPVKK